MRLDKKEYNHQKVKCCENCEHFLQKHVYYYKGSCDILHDDTYCDRVCDAYETDEETNSSILLNSSK